MQFNQGKKKNVSSPIPIPKAKPALPFLFLHAADNQCEQEFNPGTILLIFGGNTHLNLPPEKA